MPATEGSQRIANARKEVRAAARACLRPSAQGFDVCLKRLAFARQELAGIRSSPVGQAASLRNDLLLLKNLLEGAMRFYEGWVSLDGERCGAAGFSAEG